jgi:hypothetical protein
VKTREKWFTLPVAGGLTLLMTGITSWVTFNAPVALSPEQVARQVSVHQSLNYYFYGKTLAVKRLGQPAVRWSHNIIDRDTGCRELVDGYWLAAGWVQVRQGEDIRTYPWVTCFKPGEDKPLFVGAGLQSTGNFEQVLALEARSRFAPDLNPSR